MNNGEHISWHVELALKSELSSFVALTDEMVDTARSESGVLIYERFLSHDRQVVHVLERYADSASALAHLRTFKARFGDRFGAIVERKRFDVFGTPSNELKAMLDGYGAKYSSPFACFSSLAGDP